MAPRTLGMGSRAAPHTPAAAAPSRTMLPRAQPAPRAFASIINARALHDIRSSEARMQRASWHLPAPSRILEAMARFRLVLVCVVLLVGCREHRPLDPAPVESVNPAEVPPGVVQASFELNPGGDQMSSRPVAAGLDLRVAYGRKLFRQQLASCEQAGHGDALADGSSAIDWAICDRSSYSLHITDTRVEVHDGSHNVVAAIPLPPGLHLGR